METIQQNKYSLKQIFTAHWSEIVEENKKLEPKEKFIPWYVGYNVWKIMNCREPSGLGYSVYACPEHPDQTRKVPHSCKSRFCSVCAKVQIDKWVEDFTSKFPNCPYFHVVFTVPSQYRDLLFTKKKFKDAVFAAATQTLLSYCKEQGFLPAITAVLHTFGSDLKRHVHIHCVISAGGLKLTRKQERMTRYLMRKKRNPKAIFKKVKVKTKNPQWKTHDYFPYDMLQKRYQFYLTHYLKKMIEKNIESDNPDGDLLAFRHPQVMRHFFDDLKKKYAKGFYVHISKERQDLKRTVAYIGRYARRPPISEIRIKDYTGDWLQYEFKDYKHYGSKVLHKLRTTQFIKRLIRHIPPHYYNTIRHYGLLASRVKSGYMRIVNKLLGRKHRKQSLPKFKDWRDRQTEYTGNDPLVCKICKRVMQVVDRVTTPLYYVKTQCILAYP